MLRGGILFFSYHLFKRVGMVYVLSAIADYWEIIVGQLLVMVPKFFSVPLFLIESHDLSPGVSYNSIFYLWQLTGISSRIYTIC